MKRAQFLAAAAMLLIANAAFAVVGGQISVDTILPVNPVQAYSSTFSIRTDGMNWASAETILTSATIAASTFNDGVASTANLTVVSYTALSSATATGTKMNISSNTALAGACISGGGPVVGAFNVCNPAQWALDVNYSTNTACNIARAIQATGVVLSTCSWTGSTGIIYSTAPYYGSIWNSFGINSSSITALSSSTFSGGQDNQSFTINGKTFLANTDFYPITSNAVTAAAIGTAITNSSVTIGVVAVGNSNAVVYATSTAVGTATNYALASSSNAALSLSAPVTVTAPSATSVMTGGANASYLINTSTITIAGNGFGLAQAVLFSTAAAPSLTPLVSGTTYYVIPRPTAGTGAFFLATSVTNALAGTPIVLTSSQTKTTTDTFTLSPLAITGTPSIKWLVSNDNVNWIPFTTTSSGQSISTASYGTFNSTGTVTIFDFGHVDYGYLGLGITAPTTGGVTISAHVIGKQN